MANYKIEHGRIYLPSKDEFNPANRSILHPETDIYQVLDENGQNIKKLLDDVKTQLLNASSTAKKYTTVITGDGTQTQFIIQHNLKSQNISMSMTDGTEICFVDYVVKDDNSITITFDTAPSATDKFTITIL